MSTKEQEEKQKEYDEWKRKFGNEWEKPMSLKDGYHRDDKDRDDKEWQEYLHEFFKGRMS